MFSTFLTVALFVAPAIQGAYAGFAISTPTLTQCGTAKISWEPATGPYNLIVVKASDPCGDALVEVGDFTNTVTNWKANIKAGTEVILSLVDSKDQEAWSNKITVAASDDVSCLTAATTPAASTTPSTSSSSTSSDSSTDSPADPVGAANAGSNPFSSAAINTRQASMPILALAGLVAVFALL